MEKIDRRQAIKKTVLIVGGALSSSLVTAVMSGCQIKPSGNRGLKLLSVRQMEAASDLAEVILPTTKTPGAKDAMVEHFVDLMAAEWMSSAEREITLSGLDRLNEEGFLNLTFDEQTQSVHNLLEKEEGRRFFRLFKQITLLGFFTSEIGATQVLQYDEIPGSYSGCENLEDTGGITWAT